MDAKKHTESPVLHVIVVGFHHKKGCQVEYSYPPVIAGNAVDSPFLPEEWKHLPSLALPDGAHNYQKDTVFFHLPSRDPSRKTLYCVSCYRQIDAKDLLRRTADITRSTVQKSVCVICQLPLYGLLKAKLELITHAYFDERDFSKVELLEQTYNNLNASLRESQLIGTQIFLGLPLKDAVARFKHKLMVLFKLLLLERRVLFFGSPVELLGTTIFSVLSLYPGMLECGLEQAVSFGQDRQVSPTLGIAGLDPQDGGTGEDFLEVRYHDDLSAASGDAKAELREVMPHMHNSPISSICSEAPESPSIPRDGLLDRPPVFMAADDDAAAEPDGGNRMPHCSSLQLEVHKSKPATSAHPPLVRSSSDGPNSHLRVHSSSANSSLISQDVVKSVRLEDHCHVTALPCEHSPLENLDQLTKLKAVQTGHAEECLGELSLHEDNPLRTFSDSIEELDSPESISRIDKEDCFSWEEERLQLSLTVDDDPLSGSQQVHPLMEETLNQNGTSVVPPCVDTSTQQLMPQSEMPSSSSQRPENLMYAPSEKSNGTTTTSPSPRAKSRSSPGQKTAALKNKLTTALGKVKHKTAKEGTGSVEMKPIIRGEVRLSQDEFGFPLAIFTKGCVCYPYLSLQYHSILNDINVRSFVLGATNILFRQQKQVTDVIVEVEDGKLDIRDRELQKQLSLTTADLRFSELLVRMATDERNGSYLDGTEWEGSDEWIRAQFKGYLQSLLAAMQTEDPKLLEDFGIPFISAWRTTHNYRHWLETLPHPKFDNTLSGHPFQGNLSVTDVRMKLNHSMQSTERGRKINAAVMQTGKYVVQTGKAVGGAFSSARSAVSSWFTSITNDWRHEEEEEEKKGKISSEKEETKDVEEVEVVPSTDNHSS